MKNTMAKARLSLFPPSFAATSTSRSENLRDATQHLFRHILAYGEHTLYPQQSRTFPTYFPYKTVDFIFLPAPFRLVSCAVIKTYLSDHFPVILEFSTEGEPEKS